MVVCSIISGLTNKSCTKNVNSGGPCTPNGNANVNNNLNNPNTPNNSASQGLCNLNSNSGPNTPISLQQSIGNVPISSGQSQTNNTIQMVCTNPPTSSNGPIISISNNHPSMSGSVQMMNCNSSNSLLSGPPSSSHGISSLGDRSTPITSNPNNSNNNVQQQSNSNIGKAPMDSQYMQQQSQIFVFTTMLANEASEAIQSKRYNSIIAYHASQLSTQKFLEKNPFKGQFRTNCGPNWHSNNSMAGNPNMPQGNNGAPNNKRSKNSTSPQINAQQANMGNSTNANNNSNSPFTYRPPSNSSVLSNHSGNFRPGPSPGASNEMGNWPGQPETGWQSPQQMNNPNFPIMPNTNQRPMSGASNIQGIFFFS